MTLFLTFKMKTAANWVQSRYREGRFGNACFRSKHTVKSARAASIAW